MSDLDILIAYAQSGMRISTAAANTHYDRRTFRRLLIRAGFRVGIDPLDFYDLAEYLLEERKLHDN